MSTFIHNALIYTCNVSALKKTLVDLKKGICTFYVSLKLTYRVIIADKRLTFKTHFFFPEFHSP